MNFNLLLMNSLSNKNVIIPSLKDFALYTENDYQILLEDGTVLVEELYGYSPYINYTWQELPNGQSKNTGTSGTDLQLYSGNPMDFQLSQYIPIANNFTFTEDKATLLFSFVGSSVLSQEYINLAFNPMIRCMDGTTFTLYKDGITIPIFSIEVGKRYDISAMFDSLTYTIIVNNENSYTGNYTGSMQKTIPYIKIGGRDTINFVDTQMDYFIMYDGVLTPTQITQASQYPNTFYNAMKNDANTLFCTDFGGNSGYIADDKNNVTTNIHTSDFSATVDGYVVLNGTLSIANSQLTINGNGAGYCSIERMLTTEIGKDYILTLDGISTSSVSIGSVPTYNLYLSNGSIANGFKFTATTTSTKITFHTNDNTVNATRTIYGVMLNEISAVYPVINYSATQRTNFRKEPNGTQELMIERDSLGFFLGLREFPKGNGAGYCDTGWVITGTEEELSLEIIISPKVETFYHKYLQSEANKITIQTVPNSNILTFYWFSGGLNFSNFVEDTSYIFTLVKDATSSKLYVNGSLVTSRDAIQFNTTKKVLLLTEYAAFSYSPRGSIKLVKVHQKALTQEEITTNYNNYVAQGLLS
jgi:hypothetical protein